MNQKSEKYVNPKDSKKGKQNICNPALHPEFSDPLIVVADMSIEKGYNPLNWLDETSPVTVSYCIAASLRHIKKFQMGFTINNEETTIDGIPTKSQPSHLACAAYNLLMADRILKEKGDTADDRLFKEGKRK